MEDDIYEDQGLEEAKESDEIDDLEEGFMKGYDDEEELLRCKKCKRVVSENNAVEREINHETVIFCSEKCAKAYKKKK